MSDKIEVTVTPESLVTTAGGTIEAKARLHNLGQTVDQFSIGIDGLDTDWYTLPVSSVALFPNDVDDLTIIFNPPKATAAAASYPFKIIVSSQEDESDKATVDLVLELKEIIEPKINVTPPRTSGRRGNYQVSVSNPGDTEITVNLEAGDRQGALTYDIQPNVLTVPGNSTRQATLEASLGWMSIFRGDREYEFEVTATPSDGEESKTAAAKLVCIPWYKLIRVPRTQLPRISLPWLDRPPVIDTFAAATDDRIEFKLNWAVKRSKVVRLNNVDVERSGERRVSPATPVSYRLEASNRHGTVSKTVDIQPRTVSEARTSERIRASLSAANVRLAAGGAPEVVLVQLQNLGDVVDKFMIEIEGIDNDWYSRSASSVALMPQAADQVQITLQAPKKRGVKARTYSYAVAVRSQNKPDDATVVTGEIEVLPLVEYKLKVAPYRVSCRRKGKYRISLANTGMSETRVYLEATDLDEGLRFKFKNDEPVVAPWETLEIPMTAKPKRGSTIGERKRYDIVVTARTGEDTPQTANCEMNHHPLMASWKPIWRIVKLLIVLGVIGVAGYYILKLGGGWNVLSRSPQTWVNQLVRTIEGWFFR